MEVHFATTVSQTFFFANHINECVSEVAWCQHPKDLQVFFCCRAVVQVATCPCIKQITPNHQDRHGGKPMKTSVDKARRQFSVGVLWHCHHSMCHQCQRTRAADTCCEGNGRPTVAAIWSLAGWFGKLWIKTRRQICQVCNISSLFYWWNMELGLWFEERNVYWAHSRSQVLSLALKLATFYSRCLPEIFFNKWILFVFCVFYYIIGILVRVKQDLLWQPIWDSKTDSLFIKTGSVHLFMLWIRVRAAELCCAAFICESVCGTRCVCVFGEYTRCEWRRSYQQLKIHTSKFRKSTFDCFCNWEWLTSSSFASKWY